MLVLSFALSTPHVSDVTSLQRGTEEQGRGLHQNGAPGPPSRVQQSWLPFVPRPHPTPHHPPGTFFLPRPPGSAAQRSSMPPEISITPAGSSPWAGNHLIFCVSPPPPPVLGALPLQSQLSMLSLPA